MSFRLFIYYCALCGGWAALVGWALGRALAPDGPALKSMVFGLCLGLAVAFGLALLDALWNLTWRQLGALAARAGTALAVGAAGGALGSLLGYLLVNTIGESISIVLGWTIVGVLIGAAIASFEVIAGGKQRGNALRKMLKCVAGGAAGGALGGGLFLGLQSLFNVVFSGKSAGELWSPTAWGFVALGMLIGLLVGIAQVVLKEAWIKVEAGFRPGREMILAKEATSIGRAEGSDIALFGDTGVEKLHAQIVCTGGRYYLEQAAGASGTFINDQPVKGRTPLASGDLIRLGTRSMLRFHEKQKRT
jgi:hypothetical protein